MSSKRPGPSVRKSTRTNPEPSASQRSTAPTQTTTSSTNAMPAPVTPPILSPPIIAGSSTENILQNKLIIITERQTYDQLLTDAGRKHLLIEFFAPWCGACMLINKRIEELATSYNGKLIVAKVNVEECEEIAIDNGITMMPAFMLMKEKQVLEQFAGSNEEKLTSTLKKFIGEPLSEAEVTPSII